MMQNGLSEDIALRIGLAARALPDTDPKRMLQLLHNAIGLPPTIEQLSRLRVRDLKQAAAGALNGVDQALLQRAVNYLNGEGLTEFDPPPATDAYQEGDLPLSVRVACASNNGEFLDGHFGSCRRYLIYQISGQEWRLIACREADDGDDGSDRIGKRVALVTDCDILYTVSIGGPAAARVVRAGVHPIKQPASGSARAVITALQDVLKHQPPPWLAKKLQQCLPS